MNHTDARILKVQNTLNVCFAEIGARDEKIYTYLWKEFTRRGGMEMKKYRTDYGPTGMFVFPNEARMREIVRLAKEGKRAKTRNQKMDRPFRIKQTDVFVAINDYSLHSDYEITVDVIIRKRRKTDDK